MAGLACLTTLTLVIAEVISYPVTPTGSGDLFKRCYDSFSECGGYGSCRGFGGYCWRPTFFYNQYCVNSNYFYENSFNNNVTTSEFCENTCCNEVDDNNFNANSFNTILDK